MQISQALSTDAPLPQVIAFVGGGGKTTGLFRLAQELKKQKKSILVATTTKMFVPEKNLFDKMWCNTTPQKSSASCIDIWTPHILETQNKLDSIPSKLPQAVLQQYDHILIEADGAKHKPLKAPRIGEPILPTPCQMVIAVTGWEALAHPISESYVHRWPEFMALTHAQENCVLTPKQLQPLLNSPNDLFGATNAHRLWLINKLDSDSDEIEAKRLAIKILPLCPALSGIVLACLEAPDPVRSLIDRRS